jgi:hypothetical protein
MCMFYLLCIRILESEKINKINILILSTVLTRNTWFISLLFTKEKRRKKDYTVSVIITFIHYRDIDLFRDFLFFYFYFFENDEKLLSS